MTPKPTRILGKAMGDFNKKILRQLRERSRLLVEPTSAELDKHLKALKDFDFGSLQTLREKRDFLLAKCLVAELLDLRGLYEDAKPLLTDADDMRRQFLNRTTLPDAPEELNLFVQVAWLCLMRSINDHRLGQLGLATIRTQELYRYLKDFPLHRRFADLQFRLRLTLGRHLQETDGKKAQDYYVEALEYACARLDWILEGDGGDPADSRWRNETRIEEELLFSRFNTAVLSVGLARCHLDVSKLAEARGHLGVAEVLLQRTDEEILLTFVRFLIGCVHRQMKGGLSEANRILDDCLRRFDKAGHRPFFLRCRYELAKARFNSGTPEDLSAAKTILGAC